MRVWSESDCLQWVGGPVTFRRLRTSNASLRGLALLPSMIMNSTNDPLNPFNGGEVKLCGLFRRGNGSQSRYSGASRISCNGEPLGRCEIIGLSLSLQVTLGGVKSESPRRAFRFRVASLVVVTASAKPMQLRFGSQAPHAIPAGDHSTASAQ
jgi:hypothetical protein